MIRRTGAVLFVAFLLVTLFLYRKEEKRRLAEYRGLLRLISHIRNALAVSPRPLFEIYATFTDGALERSGLLPVLKARGFAAALEEKPLPLSEEDTYLLKEYAAALGGRPYAEEKNKTEELYRHLSAGYAERELLVPKRLKLVGTLFLSGGMLFLLLLL